jgi:hypothetical protein
MLTPAASVILCCMAVVMTVVTRSVVAADAPQLTQLPGSSILAQAPQGWECSVSGQAAVGDEQTSVMSCLPREGGVPINLQRMIGPDKPKSLQTYLQQWKAVYDKAQPGQFYTAPFSVQIAGKPAVEFATAAEATVFAVPPASPGPVKMVSNSIVFEDRGAFYECDLQTTPQQYTKDLRDIYHAFCDSLRFDAN